MFTIIEKKRANGRNGTEKDLKSFGGFIILLLYQRKLNWYTQTQLNSAQRLNCKMKKKKQYAIYRREKEK